MLVIPMKDHKNKTIDVLQLINRKKFKNVELTSDSVFEDEVIFFDDIIYRKSPIISNIQNLFEWFVEATVLAIEQRDTTTCLVNLKGLHR
jgi:hypothetical protein